jgi:hypothetical protein
MKKILIIFISLLFIAADCRKSEPIICHRNLKFINNSDSTIYLGRVLKSSNDISKITIMPEFELPSGKSETGQRVNCVEEYFVDFSDEYYFLSVSYYVQDYDCNIDSINNCEYVIKKADVNLEYFKNNNWTITYP